MSDPRWEGRSVLVTGHTGFMGGWLCSVLARRGAEVHGFSLPAPTEPSFFAATRLEDRLATSRIGDVRDLEALTNAVREVRPSVVFHLAAQPLVRYAYEHPIETVSTNVMGTANLLEALRAVDSVEAVVIVTTDKVYKNIETDEPYREDSELGGREPYSASKAASEFVVDAWRHSYFAPRGVGVATVRAGNIFGGGDWSADRLIPDAIRAFGEGRPLVLRRPQATRPWQHVLEPVRGYLLLAEAMLGDAEGYAKGWNFGPAAADCRPVGEVAHLLAGAWGPDARVEVEPDERIFEEKLLSLDCAAARDALAWTPRWPLETGIANAVLWYRAHSEGRDMALETDRQIDDFTENS